MNESGPQTDFRPAPSHAIGANDLTALRDEVRLLRTLLVAALMALVILGFSLNLYLFRQVSILRKELDVAGTALQEYQSKREPLINSFVTGLQEFSRNHPDLVPILERYGITPAATLPSASPIKPSNPGPGR